MVHALQPGETAPEGVEVREPVGADGPDGGPPAEAFEVRSLPRIFLVDGTRTVLATGHDLADVPAAARG